MDKIEDDMKELQEARLRDMSTMKQAEEAYTAAKRRVDQAESVLSYLAFKVQERDAPKDTGEPELEGTDSESKPE